MPFLLGSLYASSADVGALDFHGQPAHSTVSTSGSLDWGGVVD